MRIAYFDLIGGASGDMILGALIDSGLSTQKLHQELSLLGIPEFYLEVSKVTRKGFQATKLSVAVKNNVPERKLPTIIQMIEKSSLHETIKQKSISIFKRIGEVEASIHGIPEEEIHLHELGGTDTIIDIVGTLLGIDLLGIQKIYCSPIPLGRGFTSGAHGKIPLPAPATLLLLKNVPIIGSSIDSELVTPTGAALLTALSSSYGPFPAMTPVAIGCGAGSRELPIPNLLRLIIGEETNKEHHDPEVLISLETNIDDMNPEFYDHLLERLFTKGALDVFTIPVHMKKNRPGILLQVLTKEKNVQELRDIIFTETTTLGIRQQVVKRFTLQRGTKKIVTPFGPVRVKIANLPNGSNKIAPEYEDCKSIAVKHQIPIREVYQMVLSQLNSSNH